MEDIAITWLMPLLLLPGVALLIMSTSMRYGHLREEMHRLKSEHIDASIIAAGDMRRRARMLRDALTSLYVAVALFVTGSLFGAIVDFMRASSEAFIVIFAGSGIVFLIYASVELIRESRLSLKVIREYLDRFVMEMHDDMTPHEQEMMAEQFEEYMEQMDD